MTFTQCVLNSLGVYGLGAGVAAALSSQRVRSVASQVRARAYLHGSEETAMFVGTVAPAAGESAERDPVRVTITQSAEVHAGHITWRETDRTLEARPFDVVCESGRRVRVEPGQYTLLARDLAAPGPWDGASSRTVEAALVLGDRAVVYGAPHRALVPSATGEHLRDGSSMGLVLGAPGRSALTIFDEHPERVERARGRAHLAGLLAAVVAWAGLLGCFGAQSTEASATAALGALLAVTFGHQWLLSRARPWYLRERVDDVEPRRERLTSTPMSPK